MHGVVAVGRCVVWTCGGRPARRPFVAKQGCDRPGRGGRCFVVAVVGRGVAAVRHGEVVIGRGVV